MAPPRASFDPWPLLPRCPTAPGELGRATLAALAGLSLLFLLLRLVLPSLAEEFARLAALAGCLGGLGLSVVLMALVIGAAVAAPIMPAATPFKAAGLAIFDAVVHLAFVITLSGVLATLVLHHGRFPVVGIGFLGQALLLWGCHRTRLWLTGGSAA